MASKKLKTAVRVGGGPPPGYQWNVLVLACAYEEGTQLLTEEQYWHIAQQVQALARELDPTHSATADVDAIEDFWELRDKGGPLGRLNVRVYFWIDRAEVAPTIVVLGVTKKEADGATPVGDRYRMKRRKRLYLGIRESLG